MNQLQENIKSIIFAGGCFWGIQTYFNLVKGVLTTKVGYTGGDKELPKYEEVCTQTTRHAEAVYIEYDSLKTDLNKLLDHYFNITDPTTLNSQKGDMGSQYRSAIFYLNEEDKENINKYIDCIRESYENKIVTEVLPATEFWPAEEYHQNYLDSNPEGYCHLNYTHFTKIPVIDNYKTIITALSTTTTENLEKETNNI